MDRSRSIRARHAGGFSLAELMTTIAVLAIVVAIAKPGFGPASTKTLDAATAEVAAALRFARSESMRTGTLVGVSFDTLDDRLSVATYTTALASVSANHPVDKKTYVVDMANLPIGGRVDITSATFDPGARALVVFDSAGNARVWDAGGTATVAATGGSVVLSSANRQASVAIDAHGRVTLP